MNIFQKRLNFSARYKANILRKIEFTNANKLFCAALTLDKVNSASGLDLHRFNWLNNEKL